MESQDKKTVTIFLVSGQSGKTRKVIVPSAWLKAAGLVGAIFTLVFTAASIDYLGLLVQTAENKRLKAENAQMIRQYQVVEGKLNSLEASMERVRSFTAKLKLITNVEGEDRALKLAMGTTPSKGQSVDEYDQLPEQRAPVGELEEQTQATAEAAPLDESQGELVAEGGRDYRTLSIRIDKSIKESQLREQSVLDLWEALSEKQSLMSAIPSIRPARGWTTSKFGYRISPFTGRSALHTGLDFAASPGSPVYAPADGVVTFAGYDEGYGKMITIDHGYGYSTRYGHNAQIYVQVGQRVSRWDIIASVGNTGRSTGPHLHYEVRLNGIPRDPINFVLDE